MKIAKLYIKGIKDPIQLTEEKGKLAQETLNDDNLSDEVTVNIGDSWSGRKKEMRFVMFEDTGFDSSQEKSKGYSDAELKEFKQELYPYFLSETEDAFQKFVDKIEQDIKSDVSAGWSYNTMAQVKTAREKVANENADARKEAIQIVRNRLVGKLHRDGEVRFLKDKGAVKIDDEGRFIVLQNNDGSVPYRELSDKLTQYHAYIGRKEYGQEMQLRELDEVAKTMDASNYHEADEIT